MKKKKEKILSRRVKKRGCANKWKSILEGVSKDSPSLSRAYHLTRKASRVGFDWQDIKGVLNKLDEEMRELREALFLGDKRKIHEEIGDILFVMANVSRFLGIDPEEALKKTIDKFVSRFHYIEASLQMAGKPFHESNLMEMDRLWEESKRKEKKKFRIVGLRVKK